MNLPKGYISYNQIRLYQECPKKYYYTYVEEIEVPINEKVFLGMVVHSALEYYLREKIAGRDSDNKKILDNFSDKFNLLAKEREITWKTSSRELKGRGLSFVNYFLHELAESIDPLMVEEELEVELPDIGINLKGIIDLVEKDFSISDFKTSTSKWSKSRVKKSMLQMVIYKYLFERLFGKINTELIFRVLYADNSHTVKNQIIRIKPQPSDFDKMHEVIIHIAENISRGIFYKNESYVCGFCEYRDGICAGVK